MKTVIEGPGRMPYYTHMGVLVDALGGWHRDFQWLLTDCEVNGTPPALGYDPMAGPRLLTAADFDRLADLAHRVGFQIIWGSFSAFPISTRIDVGSLPGVRPIDGNLELWNPKSGVCFPAAVAEIVCWDSSAVVVTGDDEELHRRLRTYFPEAAPMPPLPRP